MTSQPPPSSAPSAPSETGSGQPGDQPMAGTFAAIPKMLKRKAEAEAVEQVAESGANSNAKKAKGGSLSENFPGDQLASLLDRCRVTGPKGHYFPRLQQAKSILRGRECAILLRLRSTEWMKQGGPIFVPAKVKLVLASQTPGLPIILQGGYQIQLRAILFIRNASNENEPSNKLGGLVNTQVVARESKIVKDAIEKLCNIHLCNEDISFTNDLNRGRNDKKDVHSDDDETPEAKDKDGDLDMDANRMLTQVKMAEMEEAVDESVYWL
ncbi:hypothetical protein BHYA_0279g00150 [Botrytis hyacinthi]|uniref:Uncharacterized protein n=1 Tax=Botrytis hyacinthi TaxID=278943 RepID=A0A4Z1GG03_9HELO|nr:hypothetical protein BHYA_0279g00150 [Botrytis hyacinthi]